MGRAVEWDGPLNGTEGFFSDLTFRPAVDSNRLHLFEWRHGGEPPVPVKQRWFKFISDRQPGWLASPACLRALVRGRAAPLIRFENALQRGRVNRIDKNYAGNDPSIITPDRTYTILRETE
jgi:hypothetical protein